MSTETELLRGAANLLRVQAAGVTPEDWFAAGAWLDDIPPAILAAVPAGFVGAGSDAVPVVLGVPSLDEQTADPRPNLEYIALMHPPVAMALADVLDAIARYGETHDVPGPRRVVVSLARAILREEPPS